MDLKSYLKLKFQKPYDRQLIIRLLSDGVLFLARLKNMTGEDKKKLLLDTIKELIDGSDLPSYDKQTLTDIIDLMGSQFIEELVKLGKDMVSFVKRKCC